MEDLFAGEWPEVVFSSSDTKTTARIHRAIKAEVLRKLAPRIYTSNMKDKPVDIIKRNRYLIISHLFPEGVISHRSALEGGVSPAGFIVLSYKYTKKISLPGLTIRLIEGPGPQPGDTPFMERLFLASRPRALLENLEPSRGKMAKSLGKTYIESHLDKLARIHGDDELNQLRDQARLLYPALGLSKEFTLLDNIIGTLLGTQNAKLSAPDAKARAASKAYDTDRVELFSILCESLIRSILPKITFHHKEQQWNNNLAFFEAYFSNYIEGTEFLVGEAKEIVFEQRIIKERPEDSHDILGTYQLVSSITEMKTTPETVKDLIRLLQSRHYTLMSVRKDRLPGKFKEIANRAGSTHFVNPELVMGTLEKAFEFYHSLDKGLPRAIYIMFVVSEIHPFVDGNGRISRIMMNSELVYNNECRIIIPTVYREDYLLALRRLSRSKDPEAYIKMLCRAQEFTASINFLVYDLALAQLKKSNAFKEPFEGKLIY